MLVGAVVLLGLVVGARTASLGIEQDEAGGEHLQYHQDDVHPAGPVFKMNKKGQWVSGETYHLHEHPLRQLDAHPPPHPNRPRAPPKRRQDEQGFYDPHRHHLHVPPVAEHLRRRLQPAHQHGLRPEALYTEELSDYENQVGGMKRSKAANLIKLHKTGERDARAFDNAYGKDDKLRTTQDLRLSNDTVSYQVLRSSPHGRHLLLITLLEGFGVNYWEPRCNQYVKMYLPDSLKASNQPTPPPDACILQEVKLNGRVLTRSDILRIFHSITASKTNSKSFTTLRKEGRDALRSLVKFVLHQKSFDSLLSVLVVLKDMCNPHMFVEAMFTIIQAREDVGFILPNLLTLLPRDYFPAIPTNMRRHHRERREWKYDAEEGWRFEARNERVKHVKKSKISKDIFKEDDDANNKEKEIQDGAPAQFAHDAEDSEDWDDHFDTTDKDEDTWGSSDAWTYEMNHVGRGEADWPNNKDRLSRQLDGETDEFSLDLRGINLASFSFRTNLRTITNNPEYRLWHIRESPDVNTMHSYWHTVLSSDQVTFDLSRRGEMFYAMHHQMLSRYNADRIAVGLDLVEAFTPDDWDEPIPLGYNSRLGEQNGGEGFYPARPDNAQMQDFGILYNWTALIDASIRNMSLQPMDISLGYADGRDFGISPLGDAVEPYGPLQETFGALHAMGHVFIASINATEDGQIGVMGFLPTAVRDPQFWRWHTFIDETFTSYKNLLGPYDDEDLGFPGVEATHISVNSQGRTNQLNTFIEWHTVRLDDNLVRTSSGGSVYRYERLNSNPYSFNIRITAAEATGAVGRIFLVPSGYSSDVNKVFIEMDKFYISLRQGENVVTRHQTESPFWSTGPPDLVTLQTQLLNGLNTNDFNWGYCGWPMSMSVPRGNAEGMEFDLVLIVTRLLPSDRQRIEEWENVSQTSWGWCGVRQGDGTMPDSRPAGFPFDRETDMIGMLRGRDNVVASRVIITHQEL